jgi:uncharacterized protein YfiM (DUF2279 family)
MSITMQDVWVAQERANDFRRFALERQQIAAASSVGHRQTMADRISGSKARAEEWLAGRRAVWHDRPQRKHPAVEV